MGRLHGRLAVRQPSTRRPCEHLGALLLAVLLALAGGCESADAPGPRAASPATAQTTSNAGTFTNPVYDENFPDPGAIRAGTTWYGYGTNDSDDNVPLLSSPDLVRWTEAGDALPELGRWASRGHTWAPEAARTAAGRYVLYYTARDTRSDRQCIGAAVASTASGPFVDRAAAPIICQVDEGGSIDASPYADPDGRIWLYWKNDGNAVGRPTHLYGQRLSADGLRPVGQPARLLTGSAGWHGRLIEAPQLFRRSGRLYLFYSANAFNSDRYAVGYATCDTPAGPCRDAPENPILRSSDDAAGPGHSFLVEHPDGSTWLLYHAWPPDAVGSVLPGRQLWLDRVDWVDGRPVVRGPTGEPQPEPGRPRPPS